MSINIEHNLKHNLRKSPFFSGEKSEKKNHQAFLNGLNTEYTAFKVADNKTIPLEQHDELLPNDLITKTKVRVKQSLKLPEYAVNGLKGDKNANFYEFLQLGNIPYWVGGPMLVWCFGAGGKDALKITRQKAVGVALYYVAAIAAKAGIDIPVKLLKGIDLNRKYRDIVPLQIEAEGVPAGKKTEYHGVYESVDFTRWDLLYKEDEKSIKNPGHINETYNNIAKKLGIKQSLNDSDSEVKPYIEKILAASTAWKTALLVPLAGLSAGLANYEGWKDFGKGLGKDLRRLFTANKNLSVKQRVTRRISGLRKIAGDHLLSPLKNSFTSLWKGKGMNNIPGGKYLGKAAILGSIASIILANINILSLAQLKKDKYVDSGSDPTAKGLAEKTTRSEIKPAFEPRKIDENTYLF